MEAILMRVDQLLARYGYCSRREARGWLRAGRVVDGGGEVVLRPEQRLDPQATLVDGGAVPFPVGLLIMLHKPVGTVCSHNQAEGPTVYDLLPEAWFRRQPPPSTVGRLDLDTSGLLLVTDRGDWVHRWTSPRSGWEKTYEVTLENALDPEWGGRFGSGDLMLRGENKPCLPARFEPIDDRRALLTLTEGRYHQVKRMFAALGGRVTGLHRVSFGPYRLDDQLPPGQWRVVDPPEQ